MGAEVLGELGARVAGAGPGRAIDIHAHFFSEGFLKAVAEGGGPKGYAIDFSEPKAPAVVRGSGRSPLDVTYFDLDRRIARMDAQGVATHALSLTTPMVHWAPPARGAELARLFNDALIEAHTAHPARFVGCATLPLQEPALALQELERLAGQRAIRSVYLPTNVNGGELADPAYFPLYERCEAQQLVVMLHPTGVIGAERLRPFYLGNLLGNPFDTTVAAANLVFGGVLDRFPRLEIVLPHAGGALPYLWGRLQRGQHVRPEARDKARLPVREYLRRFHYDTITHAPDVLRYLVGLVGADRVMLGSDYCFDMGYEQPREIVAQLGLAAAERDLILGGNAARLLGL
ncbi:MAG: amidohydrolase [Candidatus Lambdaproteobacteria bacterium]|nr:amidohydrolase [Candidatus Lambdaproteobacteria bacterium]